MVTKFSLCFTVLLIFCTPIFAQGPCFNIENVGCAETSAESETCESNSRSHGRHDRREHITIKAPVCPELAKWPGLESITMVYRTSIEIRSGKERENVMYYISSCKPKVKKLAQHIRGHWGIENGLHYLLDVTFTEDSSRIRKGSGPEVTACLRRMATNILKLDTTINDNVRGKRMRAGWNEQTLDQLIAGFIGN